MQWAPQANDMNECKVVKKVVTMKAGQQQPIPGAKEGMCSEEKDVDLHVVPTSMNWIFSPSPNFSFLFSRMPTAFLAY